MSKSETDTGTIYTDVDMYMCVLGNEDGHKTDTDADMDTGANTSLVAPNLSEGEFSLGFKPVITHTAIGSRKSVSEEKKLKLRNADGTLRNIRATITGQHRVGRDFLLSDE